MRALGLDVGSKTIGVAVADPSGTIASARSVLARKGHAADAAAIGSRRYAPVRRHGRVSWPTWASQTLPTPVAATITTATGPHGDATSMTTRSLTANSRSTRSTKVGLTGQRRPGM